MNEINNAAREQSFHRRFRHWDLNLLVALDALSTEQGSVTRAAQRLGIGQSALSHALKRLREVLGDPLFVRSGSRLVPTERAQQLAPVIASWLDTARQMFDGSAPFDLSTAQLALHLALPENIERLVVPALLRHLYQVAPGIDILGHAFPVADVIDAVDRGEVDIALIVGEVATRDWHVVTRVGRSPFLQIYNPKLVARAAPLSFEDLLQMPHLATSYSSKLTSPVDHFFEARGAARHVATVCTGIAAAREIIASRPVVAVFPSLVLADMSPADDLAIEPFGGGPLTINVSLIWHQRSDASEAHRYVRQAISEALLATGAIDP